MATNFSPCYGSYVLDQFPSIVMSGMKGFHVSASGAIQGHHGPLVFIVSCRSLYVHTPIMNSEFSPGLYGIAPRYALKKI